MALGPKIWPQGPNHLITDCWGPGESIDTHIEGFCEKTVDFLIWCQKALGPKIWTWGPNHLKTDCWGPCESIDTHIEGFCKKSVDF